MPNVIESETMGAGKRIGIVISRFNEFITTMMLKGALKTLGDNDVADDKITVVWVPGAIEIPIATQKMAQSGNYDAVITIGCVIRGGTPHFDYVCDHVTAGVGRIALDTGLPIVFGVLTTDDTGQALERADVNKQNKGNDLALAALEMINLLKKL